MSKKFGGLVKVSRSDTQGGAQTDITGKIGSGSSFEVDNTKTETTTGAVFGGGSMTGEIHFLSHEDYDTLEADMIADTEKFYHFHYKDGRVLSTKEAINTFVRKGTAINARDGVAPMILDFENYSHQVMVEQTEPS